MKKRKNLNIWLPMLMFLLAMMSTATAEIIFVDADATSANDGSSWADAYNYLQDALAVAVYGDEIRVAEGIYKPDEGVGIAPGDREATFQLKNGVTIKGGYAGFGEPDPNARNIEAYETILSGDLLGNDGPDFANNGENSYHVVTGSGTDATAVLDGFAITGGNANQRFPSPHRNGGGMYNYAGSPTLTNCTFSENSANRDGGGMFNGESSPTITNCTFSGNWARCGGGMRNEDHSSPMLVNCRFSENSVRHPGSPPGGHLVGGGMCNEARSSPTLTNCTFSGNSGESGGGMYNRDSNPMVTNCVFIGNSAKSGGGMTNYYSSPSITNCTFSSNSATGGGGMCNSESSPSITNCTFSGNSANRDGGGMFNGESSPTITNCTFSSNSATRRGGGMSNAWSSTPMLTNCILWGNEAPDGPEIYIDGTSSATVSYSDVQGSWPGEGNIDADPLFVELGYWDPNGTPGDVNDDFWIEGDYHLLEDSPCIDAGDPNYVAEPNETDLDGRPRVVGGQIDMGAYEYNPPIPAEVRIVPRTINLTSRGKWITSLFWLPEDYDVADIEPNSVVLEFLDEEIKAESFRVDEEQQVAVVRFSRSEVQNILEPGGVELSVSGELTDGTRFEGTDVIRVIDKGGKNIEY